MEYAILTIYLGSKSVVCARVGGANTTSFLATHFAKRNTKNCGSEKRVLIFPDKHNLKQARKAACFKLVDPVPNFTIKYDASKLSCAKQDN